MSVAPIAFYEALGESKDLGPAKINAMLPAMVGDIVSRQKPPTSLDVKAYLEGRAQDVRDRSGGDRRLGTLADRIDEVAKDVKLDASLFSNLLDLSFMGQTAVVEPEAEALVRIYEWLLDRTPVDKKRSFLIDVHTKLQHASIHPLLDDLETRVAAEIEKAGIHRGDQIDAKTTTTHLATHELARAEMELMRLVPFGTGQRMRLDQEKIDWFKYERAGLTDDKMSAEFKLIEAALPQLEKKASFLDRAFPDTQFVKVNPDAIPDPEVRAAAKVAAIVVNDKSASTDAAELNFNELNTALLALQKGGDRKTRDALLKKYNELRNVKVHDRYKAKATEALRAHLQVVHDFMSAKDNSLLDAGYASVEIGDWSRPWRRPVSRVGTYYPLPNKEGKLDYKIPDDNPKAATEIFDAHKVHLEQTALNCVSFTFENRVWVAIFPYGDLESVMPGRTEISLFDPFEAKSADSTRDDEPQYEMRGTGRVIGKVDPLHSSGGEAIFRTANLLVSSFAGAVQSVLGAEDTGEKAFKQITTQQNLLPTLGIVGAGGFAAFAIEPLAVALVAALPSAAAFTRFLSSKKTMRPIFELMGAVVTPGSERSR